MKRKIVIGMSIVAVVAVVASSYLAFAIGSMTAGLERLITLHRVEDLREGFLLQLRRTQLDVALHGAHDARGADVVVADAQRMKALIEGCFQCHHPKAVAERLDALGAQTDRYTEAVGRLLSAPFPSPGASASSASALEIGERLTGQVRDMVDATTRGLEEQTQRTLGAITRARHVSYALVALGPLLALMLGFVVVSGLTRPLDVLLESTRRLRDGDLDHRVGELPDEFQELALAFNDMASSLKEHMRRTQRTEQMVVVGQLAAGLAHEIKNPLGGIKAAMQVLAEEANLSGDDRDVVERVSREVTRLEALMKNFLTFAKPAKPQLAELNVNELINMILNFYVKRLSDSPSQPASVSIAKDLQPVPATMADPMQLQQILLNLLLNAVDSMPNGGTLSVRTLLERESIHIEIADTGRGVATEHVDKIFQPFFTTKPKGSGLGLAISKQLVEQHGGSITVASKPAGGAVFRVILPWVAPKTVTA